MNKLQRAEKTKTRDKSYLPDNILDLEELAAKFTLAPQNYRTGSLPTRRHALWGEPLEVSLGHRRGE